MYLNNGDGTFTNEILNSLQQTSFFGMGVDAADFNNDGWVDIFQLDMNAADNFRSKANMSSMNPVVFYQSVALGLHHQYMQNSLQLNQGNLFQSPALVILRVGVVFLQQTGVGEDYLLILIMMVGKTYLLPTGYEGM